MAVMIALCAVSHIQIVMQADMMRRILACSFEGDFVQDLRQRNGARFADCARGARQHRRSETDNAPSITGAGYNAIQFENKRVNKAV
jgi:hypothetical protein